jgi:hypothetical protein
VTPLAEHEEEIASVIRAEAGEVLAQGRATLEVVPSDGARPAMCELRPANEAACAFVVQIDSARQLTLYLGRYGTICELYTDARLELLGEVGQYLRAAVAGRYRESVRLTDGELSKARGVLVTEDAEVRIFSSNVGTIGRRGPWERFSYEAY